MKKHLSDSRNLTKKMTKLHIFFKNQNQLETKINSRTNLLFLNENRKKRVIPKILYKLVKTMYLLFV